MLTLHQALEVVGLSLASIFLILKFIINAVIGARIGPVKNDTGDISNVFETQVAISAYCFLVCSL